MAVQKLSSKNQIVIPKEARQAMGVKGGDELLVVVKDDLTPSCQKPKRYARTLQGLCQGHLPIRLPQARTPFMVESFLRAGSPD